MVTKGQKLYHSTASANALGDNEWQYIRYWTAWKLTLNSTLWNIGEKIVNKLKQYNRYRLNIINEEDRKQYTICVGKQWCGSRVSSGT